MYVGENSPTLLAAALDFAKSLNCVNATCCGVCFSCRAFDSGSHPDTFFVASDKKTIGVDEIREQLIKPMTLKPHSHAYKVFIIERAQDLTHQAQNVLLKTIEEPAGYGAFLFLAPNTRSFLPTVLSRCDIVRVVGSPESSGPPEVLDLANKIFASLGDADLYGAFLLYEYVQKLDKLQLMQVLDELFVLFAGELCECGGDIGKCDAILDTKRNLSYNGNTQLAIELLFARLKGADD